MSAGWWTGLAIIGVVGLFWALNPIYREWKFRRLYRRAVRRQRDRNGQ